MSPIRRGKEWPFPIQDTPQKVRKCFMMVLYRWLCLWFNQKKKKLMAEEPNASKLIWKSAAVFGFLVPRTCSLLLLSTYSGCGTAIDLGWVSPGDSQTQHRQFSKMNGIWGEVWLCRLWTPHANTAVCPALATWCSWPHKATQHPSCTCGHRPFK